MGLRTYRFRVHYLVRARTEVSAREKLAPAVRPRRGIEVSEPVVLDSTRGLPVRTKTRKET